MRILNPVEQIKSWLGDPNTPVKGKAVFSADGAIEFVPLTPNSFEEKRGPGLGFHVHPVSCKTGNCTTPLPSQTDVTDILAKAAMRGEFILSPYGIFFLSAEDIALSEDKDTCTGPLCKAVTNAYVKMRRARKPEHAYRAFMQVVPSLSDEFDRQGMKLSFWPVDYDNASHVELPGFTAPEFPTPPFKLPEQAPVPLASGILVGVLALICTWFLTKQKKPAS